MKVDGHKRQLILYFLKARSCVFVSLALSVSCLCVHPAFPSYYFEAQQRAALVGVTFTPRKKPEAQKGERERENGGYEQWACAAAYEDSQGRLWIHPWRCSSLGRLHSWYSCMYFPQISSHFYLFISLVVWLILRLFECSFLLGSRSTVVFGCQAINAQFEFVLSITYSHWSWPEGDLLEIICQCKRE